MCAVERGLGLSLQLRRCHSDLDTLGSGALVPGAGAPAVELSRKRSLMSLLLRRGEGVTSWLTILLRRLLGWLGGDAELLLLSRGEEELEFWLLLGAVSELGPLLRLGELSLLTGALEEALDMGAMRVLWAMVIAELMECELRGCCAWPRMQAVGPDRWPSTPLPLPALWKSTSTGRDNVKRNEHCTPNALKVEFVGLTLHLTPCSSHCSTSL